VVEPACATGAAAVRSIVELGATLLADVLTVMAGPEAAALVVPAMSVPVTVTQDRAIASIERRGVMAVRP
jgi:hypothetical protein